MECVVETAAVVMLAMMVATAEEIRVMVVVGDLVLRPTIARTAFVMVTVMVLPLVVLAMQKGQLRAPGLVLTPVVTQVAEPLVAGMKVALVLVSVATGTVFVAVEAAATMVVGTEAVLVVI